MRTKSNKLSKLEKERFSVFYELNACCYCGSIYQLTKHEIFEGRNRQNSMKYGAVQPLCRKCHSKITNNTELENKWKIKGQKKVMEYYKMSVEEFIEIFGKNYI